jgi:hypothetical protein
MLRVSLVHIKPGIPGYATEEDIIFAAKRQTGVRRPLSNIAHSATGGFDIWK